MTDERRIKPTFLERQCPDRRDAPAGFAILAIASLIAIAAAFPLITHYGGVGAIAACAIGWFVAVAGTGLLLARGQVQP